MTRERWKIGVRLKRQYCVPFLIKTCNNYKHIQNLNTYGVSQTSLIVVVSVVLFHIHLS